MSDFWPTPWTVACQAPLSMQTSRQEYWSELPFPSPGNLPNPGIEPGSPTWQEDSLLVKLNGRTQYSFKPTLLIGHGVARSRTWLSDFTFTFHFHALEKEMAIHSSVLAWRIPGTGEPGGLLSMGSHRVRHDWSNLAAAAAPSFLDLISLLIKHLWELS